jgi:hypothetical protein
MGKQLADVTGRLTTTAIACSVLVVTWMLAATALFWAF